jgi:hypothetical protein
MCVVASSAHSSDVPSDISGPLLLPHTVATCYMTLDDCCYCWARGMRVVAISPHSSDRCSDISGSSLLDPTIATVVLTLVAHRY